MDYYYLIYLPVTLGIGGVMTFLLNRRWLRLYDRIYLAMMVCILITVYVVIRAIVIGTQDYAFLVLDNLETLLGLSVCPLFYLYIRTMTHDNRWHHWYCCFFVPALLLCAAGTTLSLIVGWDRIIAGGLNGYVSVNPVTANIVEKWYMIVNAYLFDIIMEVMAVVLIGMSIHHLYMYYKRAGDYYANLEESCFDNMNRFLFCGILFLLGIFLITCFICKVYVLCNGIRLVLSFCLSVLLVIMTSNAYQIKVSLQNVEAMSPFQAKEQDAQTPENDADDILGQRILAWESRKDKPYCKEGLTLVVLARELCVSRRALSAYINSHKGVNFNLWINTLRLEEAKRMLRLSRDLKIGYISDICGFGTQSAFSKIFRRMENMTPQEYRDMIVL